jgi:cobalt-zinc-cadmium efflux system membrane fusion protein
MITKKQKTAIALMCAVAALLAALMLWRRPSESQSAPDAHAQHKDAHGHDDRHAEGGTAPAAAEEGTISMTAAQVAANGIAIDAARPASIGERLHLPAQVLVDGDRSVAVAAPAMGMVQSVLVAPGATVARGQGVVVLHSPDVAQWRADSAVAAQRLRLARTVLERERKLWEGGISARQDFDAADSAFREAQIAQQAARQRLAALNIGVDERPSSAVTVRAPLAGVVVERPAVAGMAADPGKPLLTIANLDQVWVEATVPADSLGQATVGMPATISATALAQEQKGSVAFVGPVLGEATRTAVARIVLPNPGLRLRPGMLADVDLMGRQSEAAVTVASDALQTIHERTVVFVRTQAGFAARTVTTGRSDGKRTEIVAGLATGTPHAVAGSYLLKAELGKGEVEHED